MDPEVLLWVRRVCLVSWVIVRQAGQCDAERIKITLFLLETDEAFDKKLVVLGPAVLISRLKNGEYLPRS